MRLCVNTVRDIGIFSVYYKDGDGLGWNSNPNPRQLANVTCKTHDKGQPVSVRSYLIAAAT